MAVPGAAPTPDGPAGRRTGRPRARRQPAIVAALARALAQQGQLPPDPGLLLAQLAGLLPVAAVVARTAAPVGDAAAVRYPASPDGCAAAHGADLDAAVQQAADAGTPFLTLRPCAAGDHQIFAAPASTSAVLGAAPAGTLAALSLAGQSFSDGDLLLLTLAALRLDAVQRREGPGPDGVRGRLLAEVIAAAENERKRIAHDIHDDTLQMMGMQLVKVQIIRRLVDRGLAADAARELETLAVSIQENADRLRAIMSELRPSTLRDYGLLATIDSLIQGFAEQTGVPVAFVSRLGRRLPDDHETMVYRIVQEALSNIRQHAGATQASITLEGIGDWYTLVIEDNGRGFDPREAMERSLRTGHFGLITMRERAELIGGSLRIESAPGSGTRLHFHLPRLS